MVKYILNCIHSLFIDICGYTPVPIPHALIDDCNASDVCSVVNCGTYPITSCDSCTEVDDDVLLQHPHTFAKESSS